MSNGSNFGHKSQDVSTLNFNCSCPHEFLSCLVLADAIDKVLSSILTDAFANVRTRSNVATRRTVSKI